MSSCRTRLSMYVGDLRYFAGLVFSLGFHIRPVPPLEQARSSAGCH